MQIHRYQAYFEIMHSDYGRKYEHLDDLVERMLAAENMQLLWIYADAHPDANIGIYGGTHEAFVQEHPAAWKAILRRVADEWVEELDRNDLVRLMTGEETRICDWDPKDVLRHALLYCNDIGFDQEEE